MTVRLRLPRRALAAATAGALALSLAACGGTTKESAESSGDKAGSGKTANPNAPMEKGLKLAFLPKQVNNPYMKIVDDSGIAAAKGFEAEAKEVGPSDASASSQVSYINTLIQQQHDAIMISANDPNAVCGPLKQAMQQDIAIVAYDSDTAPECRDVFIKQASSEDIARTQVEMLAEQIDSKGKFAILSATANATNQNAWIELMKKELEKPEYAEMELVKVAYGDDDDQKSFQQTQGLLQAYPDLKGIIAPTTVGIAAAARYIDGSEYKGKVAVTGLGTPNQMRQFIKNKTVEEFALWDPKQLGYLAAYAGGALASGQITGKEGEVLKAGDLGERTIQPNGEIVLGPPTKFNTENIDEYQF